ncbi:MAG: nicotinate phosphoribosyltransferase [Peptococcaceae bacterium]|jgi:nicotinate phosphoribosyltransferase|nr:nicotinate phosphoribosyltransferase [Peptococcaceae bacterium]
MNERNLTLLTDFYEITMANGYFAKGKKEQTAVFDMFFRRAPDGGGYAVMAGVGPLIDYLENLRFTDADIAFLRNKGFFQADFLEFLRTFRFECDVWAIPEGTPIFPGEPLVVVKGPILQGQFVETMILLTVNHQSLIATKANRMYQAAKGRGILEFGSRRAQGYDGAVLGARAAYIGGCSGTACTMADLRYGIPAAGTMAHSWVQSFDSEYEAFKAYAQIYPDQALFLVDTYNVVRSGIPNAIRVFNEVVLPMGFRPKGIRLDSGDLAYLSKQARTMLDEAGFEDARIVASNALDEYIIRDLMLQGAAVDTFGVGERLITACSDPIFGGVYKLVAMEKDGRLVPKIKISEDPEKIINPHFKQVYRLYSKGSHRAIGDVITLFDEGIDESRPYELFHPDFTWKRKTVRDFEAKPLLTPVFAGGKRVYESPGVHEIRDFCRRQVDQTLWDEVKRFENPHRYYVDLSQKLWDIKQNLLREETRKYEV